MEASVLCFLEPGYDKLHLLTTLGILHIAALVTLGESHMGIEPQFDFWYYFFRFQPWLGSSEEVAVWGNVGISVRSRLGVSPYFQV
jgi:hypothetical protein